MKAAKVYFIGSAAAVALLWVLRDVPVLSHPAVNFYFMVVPPFGVAIGIGYAGILFAMHDADVIPKATPLVILSAMIFVAGRVLLG